MVQSEAGLLSVTGTRATRWRRSASRCPTSPPACTPTARSSPRCSSAGRPARARTSTCPCSRRPWSGWGSRSTTPTTARSRHRVPARRTRRSTRTARSSPRDEQVVMMGIQNDREWRSLLRRGSSATPTSPTARRTPRTPPAATTATSSARSSPRGSPRSPATRRPRALAADPGGVRAGQLHARRLGAPAARGARALARDRDTDRRRPVAGAAGVHHHRAADGPGARARRAHPQHRSPSSGMSADEMDALEADGVV